MTKNESPSHNQTSPPLQPTTNPTNYTFCPRAPRVMSSLSISFDRLIIQTSLDKCPPTLEDNFHKLLTFDRPISRTNTQFGEKSRTNCTTLFVLQTKLVDISPETSVQFPPSSFLEPWEGVRRIMFATSLEYRMRAKKLVHFTSVSVGYKDWLL